jgi:hypothetical protein
MPDEERAVVARYEAMSKEEIVIELRNAGIDPQPTIDAVRELVRRKLAEVQGEA